ncbi:protein furry [Schistocerca piceifrons]|uniref:protein furry n=1 Tax=Schistocerca piceifrons TaxID=274613 RepID=UPI001F5F18C8|nr:protein furry [Schistocerca piceifrons]
MLLHWEEGTNDSETEGQENGDGETTGTGNTSEEADNTSQAGTGNTSAPVAATAATTVLTAGSTSQAGSGSAGSAVSVSNDGDVATVPVTVGQDSNRSSEAPTADVSESHSIGESGGTVHQCTAGSDILWAPVGDSPGAHPNVSIHASSAATSGESNKSITSLTVTTITTTSLSSNATVAAAASVTSGCSVLPWGAHKERSPYPPCVNIDMDIRPGEFVMRTIFAEFTVQAERKMEAVMAEPPERPLSKVLQRGEDAQFDQLLTAFGSVAEHCLPSILRALFAWYERQVIDAGGTEQRKTDLKGKSTETTERSEADILQERRDLAVEFIFCLVLIEVLKQLPFHPGQDDLVGYIENLAFKHFKYREGIQTGPNAANIHIIADLYAEVIGALAQSRFMSVRKRFMAELKELKSKEPNPNTAQSIISLLMGMKFFRVKMVPIEEFEASFQFMQECAQYFLEVKDKDIKHALAGLFVEILVPVAATVKNEVNVPCLKNFVEMLYSQTLDMCTKSKHRLAIFPLVTCLLCVSQKIFFLQNWHYFLAMCLSHLKNRDPKMCRVALESLYRLLWVYMIRIKCESNSATQSRLQSIVNSLFPKGSKAVVPRDTPLNIFVKIIQFIAQERLDFAMREIVFDLLSVGRPIKIILTPERMSIGLRAFLVVADSLEQKEGEPPMPRTMGVLPSGNTLRVKKTYLNKMLTEDTARTIGMSSYFPHVRRVFVDILRALDVHYGRPLMMTSTQNVNKEPDEMITGERKPRIDLFRTCVAAVPRLIPDGMTGGELVDLLSRLTVHMDEELRGLAYQSLQTLVLAFSDWRQDVIYGFTQFLARDVQDTFPQLMDNGLRMLLQLLTSWKNALTPNTLALVRTTKEGCSGTEVTRVGMRDLGGGAKKTEHGKAEPVSNVFHMVEGFALVMLCNCRLYPRRLAVHILKEVKALLKCLGCADDDQPVIDVIDQCCPQVLEKCLSMLPPAEKAAALSISNIDLQWIADRNSCAWTAGLQDENNIKASSLNLNGADPWATCLFGFMERGRVLTTCPTAVMHSWPFVFGRVNTLFTVIDPTPVNDNRASLLRGSATVKKPVNERDMYMHLWKNYVTFAFRVVPPVPSPIVRCASPDLSLSSSPDSLTMERNDNKSPGSNISPAALYKLVVPLLRCETPDVRDAAVHALGKVNSDALKDLMEELSVYIREAVDRKQENMRRRRRRDALRLQLVRVLELIAEYGTFGNCQWVLDRETQSLHPTFVEYVDGARLYLESEADKDVQAVKDIKFHFCNFIRKMIKSFSLETCQTLLKRDLRQNLFNLFSGWSGHFGRPLASPGQSQDVSAGSSSSTAEEKPCSELQLSALQAMSALLCCGPCFNPAGLSEDGIFYPWLDLLLASSDDKIYQLARETAVLLLECNPDIGPLLDWVVDRCYTGSPQVADGCFLALATIFSAREYPCDHYTAVINVTLLSTGCPRTHVHETALQLLQILDRRFFGTVGPLPPAEGDLQGGAADRGRDTLDLLLSTTYCRSQMYLSRQLAQLHPELTMPMFSEITHRFQTARPEVRQLLLQYLLPWLYNMELVDPNVPPANPLSYFQYYAAEMSRPGSRREGWGSAEATEMVLNNLFYITAKFADVHPKETEEVWATLCSCWPNNLKVIIRYLIIVSGMAPNELLPYAKRVALYLARARPERLLDEMMTELQTVETLNCLIERTETPPFYRLTSMRKASSHSEGGGGAAGGSGGGSGSSSSDPASSRSDLGVEKGTIHTKRHSGEDPTKTGTSKSDTALRALAGFPTPRTEKTRTASGPPMVSDDLCTPSTEPELIATEDGYCLRTAPIDRFDIPQPHPLPMPEYGGYFAPLTEYLPDSSQPISGFHRCNVAVMLLVDVVVDGVDLDWSIHVPLMLHILFLGLDHSRQLVHEHCRMLLLNLLVALADHCDHLTVAHILLNCKTGQLGLGLPTPALPVLSHIFTEPNAEFDSYLHSPIPTNLPGTAATPAASVSTHGGESSGNAALTQGTTPPVIVTPEDATAWTGPQPGPNMPIQDVIKSLIEFIASRHNQPLWNYEDITAKVWSVRSVEQLDTFLQHVLRVFRESLPHALISERWAQTALQLGLSCSSRHYAGRSLQVFRALRVPITSRMLSDILSRLVETVAEQGEDMQGYVTELLLTLEAAVDSLESDFRPLDFMKEIFKSTPNLNNKESTVGVTTGGKRSPGGVGVYQGGGGPVAHHTGAIGHTRSTSYSVSYCTRKATGSPATDGKDIRGRASSELEARSGCSLNKYSTNLSRSRSAQSLKLLGDTATQDDKMTILAQLFWLSVSLLESDYEHEFLLALRLLSRVLHRLPLDRPDARDKVEKLQAQLKWPAFPGVHALLLKGCTNPNTYEPVVTLLSQFTQLLDLPVVDPTQSLAFPMNVMALLPYMLLHYEDTNDLCIRSAENIAQVSTEKSKKLENLGTVMTLYSRRTFSKESFQWTKCVVKYLYDTYGHLSLSMLSFLVEVLEKGPAIIQLPILGIIHCMLHYVDLASAAVQLINADLLRVIAKYIEGPHYKEALKILKLVVTRSSTLVAPPTALHPPHWENSANSPHPSFADGEIFTKKELPGRTMEFTFDLSQTPIIGRRFLTKIEEKNSQGEGAASSPRRSVSLSPADNTGVAGWKRPWMSQSRVRECLVNLLTTCGQRVGLPKSPSVIFSQSSDLMERQSSMASSTEEVSGPNNDLSVGSRRDEGATDQFKVFKDFDFLEYESESVEGESTDNFNWGVRRRPVIDGETERDHSLQQSISDRTPVPSKKMRGVAEESSDDEVGSESPLDEVAVAPEFGNTAASGSGAFPPGSLILRERRERHDSGTRSDTSGSSVGDLGDVTPCNASPNLSAMTFRNIIRDDSEETWRLQIQSLLNQFPVPPLELFQLLQRLIKDVSNRAVSMTQEACRYLSSEGAIGPCAVLGMRLQALSDLLAAHIELPHVWIGPAAFSTTRTSETLRFGMLEIQEHWETFLDRKDHATECIDAVKTTFKLHMLGESQTDLSNEDIMILDMGRALYKLHFQLRLLIEASHKMVTVLTTAAKSIQLQDVSTEVLAIRAGLLRVLEEGGESDHGTPTPTPSPVLGSSSEDAEATLLELLRLEKWGAALCHARQYRGAWSGDIFSSMQDDDDMSIILNVYFKHLSHEKPDAFVVTRSEQDMNDAFSRLMESLYLVLKAVNGLENQLKDHSDVTLRKTEC